MPKQYIAIRDSLVKRGYTFDEAQAIAAATYNKHHPSTPMRSEKAPRRKPKHEKASRAAIRKNFL